VPLRSSLLRKRTLDRQDVTSQEVPKLSLTELFSSEMS
jgi:hypothetical protein